MTPVLAFDIETAPDCDGLRRLYDLDPALSDKDVAEIAFQRRRTAANHDFLQLHQHRVIAIACALREGDGFRVWSLGTADDREFKWTNYISRYHAKVFIIRLSILPPKYLRL